VFERRLIARRRSRPPTRVARLRRRHRWKGGYDVSDDRAEQDGEVTEGGAGVSEAERLIQETGMPDREEDAPEALPAHPGAFVRYFLGFYTWPLAAMALLEFAQAACQILIPKALQQLIDSATPLAGTDGGLIWTSLRAPLWFFVSLSIGILVFSRSSGAILVMLGPALRRRVRHSLYRYLQSHSQRYFLGNFAGSLANRIGEVSLGVNYSTWTVMFDFWPVTVTLAVSLVLLAQVHAWLALVLGFWTLGYVAVSYVLASRCREYAKDFAATRSVVTGKIVDAVTNVMSSKLFARMEHERSYLRHYLDQEVKAARRTFWFMERMRWFQFVATLSLQVGMIVYAARLWLEGAISVGAFAMVASLLLMVINDVRNLSRRFLEFFEYVGNISDGVSVIIRPHEVTNAVGARDLSVTAGEIRFENVDFAYPGGVQVFQGLTLTVQPGTRVGLVGFSGSGKSTFANLILRLYDIQGGRILIDGQDIQRVTQDSLRRAIAMISQEPMLFHRSLLENVRYGRLEATDDEVQDAARSAHAHEFITSLPDAYDALVGERGVRLSGGQRQRIVIARAVLKNAPILLMDEATSSLDSVTERLIQDAIEGLMRGRTSIVIAHRLSTIAHLDRVVVFHEGAVVEDGTHEELLAKRGHYARLWSMQAGGFLPEHEDESPEVAAAEG
jgi:ATP-binding cassette subfamily B protein